MIFRRSYGDHDIFSKVKMRVDLPQDRRKMIGRRMLEVAIATAMDCIEPISDGRDDAKRIMQLSDNAAGSLSRLLDYLAGRKADNRAEAVWHVLRQFDHILDPNRGDWAADELFSLHEVARRDALTLESALSALRWIGVAAKQKQRLIAARNKNFGVADQHAFVRVLGETWLAVTGELPNTKKSRKGEIHFFELFVRPLGRTRVTRPEVETSSPPLIRQGSRSCRQPLRARR